jgi:hypothetical protein
MTLIKAVLVAWVVLVFLMAGVTAIGWVVYAATAMLTGSVFMGQVIGYSAGAFCLFAALIITACLIGGDDDE